MTTVSVTPSGSISVGVGKRGKPGPPGDEGPPGPPGVTPNYWSGTLAEYNALDIQQGGPGYDDDALYIIKG